MKSMIKVFLVLMLFSGALLAQTVDLSKAPDAKIMVPIVEKTAQGDYHDSLFYTAAEFAKLTTAQITAAKQARVTAWLKHVEAASKAPKVEPTEAELTEQKEELVKRMADIDDKLKAVKDKDKDKKIK